MKGQIQIQEIWRNLNNKVIVSFQKRFVKISREFHIENDLKQLNNKKSYNDFSETNSPLYTQADNFYPKKRPLT